MHRMPWSTRSTPSTSIASQTYDGGPSSPACATRWKPSSAAAAKAGAKSRGGWPTSVESSPTPAIAARWGSSDCDHLEGGVRPAVSHHARDQRDLRASAGRTLPCGPGQPRHHVGQRHPARRVLLRVEEHLRPHHAVGARPGEVRRARSWKSSAVRSTAMHA